MPLEQEKNVRYKEVYRVFLEECSIETFCFTLYVKSKLNNFKLAKRKQRNNRHNKGEGLLHRRTKRKQRNNRHNKGEGLLHRRTKRKQRNNRHNKGEGLLLRRTKRKQRNNRHNKGEGLLHRITKLGVIKTVDVVFEMCTYLCVDSLQVLRYYME